MNEPFQTNARDFEPSAAWITCPEQKEPLLGGMPATYFRKTFSVNDIRLPAEIAIAALGLFALFVNEKKANPDVLAAPFTNYDKTVLYHVYHIGKFLHRGKNKIEVIVGDGWCNQNAPETWGFSRASWKTTNKMICTAHLGNDIYVSDESWEVCQDGPVYRSALRLGEFHNNDLVPSYSSYAKKCEPPRGKLVRNHMHEIRECKKLKPKTAIESDNGILLDFGQNIAGYIGFCINGHSNQVITVTYGDKLTDGKIDNLSNAQYITDETLRKYFQVDKVILKNGKNEYKPLFVYHGFRYAFIEGICLRDAQNVAAFAVRTSFPQTGEFSCSLSRLNTLQKMCLASTEANFVGIPTDCPHREKNGWTGDLQLSVEQMLYNYDCATDLKKYLYDICDCQLDNGCIPCIAPTAENCFGYDWGNGPVWDLALFEIPYRLARLQNDFETAKNVLPALEKYYAYAETKQNALGLYEFGLGDWNTPQCLPKDATPLALVSSCSVLQMTRILKFFHTELFGSDGGFAEKESLLANAIRAAFVKSDGNVADNSVCSLAAVLYYNLASEREKSLIFNNLLRVLYDADHTMQFGILGNKYIYRVLCENDRSDVALKLLKNDRYPSFGHWIRQGAVTLWEDFEGTNSRNHYMFSDISAVFYQYFAGISYAFEHGVQHNTIRLCNIPQIKNLRAKLFTPNGILQIQKQTIATGVEYTLTVPADSVTTVIYPNGNTKQFRPNETYTFTIAK